MTEIYRIDEIRQNLAELLDKSQTGLSGVEISSRLKISRVTMAKYLNVFAAEGMIRPRSVGRTTLWLIEEGAERFSFPDDYFRARKAYLDSLLALSENRAYALVRSCLHSGAAVPRLMIDVITPAIGDVRSMLEDGKMGNSELNLINGIISDSIKLTRLKSVEADPKKNIVLMAAGPQGLLLCEAAAAAFHSEGWAASMLGDMSESINVLFDLDLQKFLGKVWRQKPGVMIIVVFSDSQEHIKFFAESVNATREKTGGNVRLVICGRTKKPYGSDLVAGDIASVLQWSQTVYEGSAR